MEINSSVTIQDNILNGTMNAPNSVGLVESGTYAALITDNTFQNLETVIKIGNNLYDGVTIESNTFTDNAYGIAFSATNISNMPPKIRCNTFQALNFTGTSRGIFIPQNVRITAIGSNQQLGGPANLSNFTPPNGNRFIGLTNPIYNIGTSQLTYYRYNSSQEDLTGSFGITNPALSTAATIDADPSGACGTSSDPGVYARLSNSSTLKIKETGTQDKEIKALGQSYPNLGQAETTIPYTLPEGCHTAAIRLQDLFTGKEIKRYELKAIQGPGSLILDLRSTRMGLYAYTLLIDDKPIATLQLAVSK